MQRRTFNFFNNLIHNGQTEIILDRDIILGDNEENEFREGINIDIDNIVIDGNGHTIDAMGKTRIFNVSGKNFTIKNISLINGFTKDYDNGAIILAQQDSSLNIDNTNFINGHSSNNAGAVFSLSNIINIKNSEFKNNGSENNGGAIFISQGIVIIENTEFVDNTSEISGGAITNMCELNIKNSKFINNHGGTTGAISNTENAEISDTIFYGNKSKSDGGAIANLGNIIVKKSKFKENTANNGNDIYHTGDSCKLENNQFSESEKETIYHPDHFPINLNSCEFNVDIEDVKLNIEQDIIEENKGSNETILNNQLNVEVTKNTGDSSLQDILNPLEKKYFDLSIVSEQNDMSPLKEGTFKYLDSLIHNDAEEIILTSDITLDLSQNEELEYEYGIDINIDNFTIDGNGHTIDAKGKSRIFNITGKNITIKNIIFKNAFVKMLGGAINSFSNTVITNCKFVDNSCENNGGAIYNFGEMTINNTCFFKNRAHDGGSILNLGKIELNDSKFHENTSKNEAGAIYNQGKLELNNCVFQKNKSIEKGGAIFNDKSSSLKSINTKFDSNTSKDGGSISNEGKFVSINSNFIKNISYQYGGAIFDNHGTSNITDNIFIENKCLKDRDFEEGGGAICNINGSLIIRNSIFKDNVSNYTGGAIKMWEIKSISNRQKDCFIDISNTLFSNNKATNKGGAIYSITNKPVKATDCKFKDNFPNDIENY